MEKIIGYDQTPLNSDNWLTDMAEVERLFVKVVHLPIGEAWKEVTNEERKEWEKEHSPEFEPESLKELEPEQEGGEA